MASNGGADSDGHDNLAPRLAKDRSDLRKILGFIAFMAVATILVFGGSDMIHAMRGQEMARNAARECSTKRDSDHCEDRVNSARSATATEDAVRVALWQMVLNVAGIAGLFFTVLYARATWKEAKASAEAARDALDISKETSAKELRAYISVHSSELQDFTPGNYPKATVTIKNDGQTPAFDVIFFINVATDSYPLQEEFPAIDWSDSHRSREPLGPGVTRTMSHGSILLSEGDLQHMKSGTWAFYVYGEVRYRDIFDKPHSTKYRLFVGGKVGFDIGLSAHYDGNEAD